MKACIFVTNNYLESINLQLLFRSITSIRFATKAGTTKAQTELLLPYKLVICLLYFNTKRDLSTRGVKVKFRNFLRYTKPDTSVRKYQ